MSVPCNSASHLFLVLWGYVYKAIYIVWIIDTMWIRLLVASTIWYGGGEAVICLKIIQIIEFVLYKNWWHFKTVIFIVIYEYKIHFLPGIGDTP